MEHGNSETPCKLPRRFGRGRLWNSVAKKGFRALPTVAFFNLDSIAKEMAKVGSGFRVDKAMFPCSGITIPIIPQNAFLP